MFGPSESFKNKVIVNINRKARTIEDSQYEEDVYLFYALQLYILNGISQENTQDRRSKVYKDEHSQSFIHRHK